MSLPVLAGNVASRLGLGALVRGAASKVGEWLFGTRLRSALTGVGIGQLLFGGSSKESAATRSSAAAQVQQYRG